MGSTEVFVAKSFSDLIDSNLELKSSWNQFGKIYVPLPSISQETTKYVIGISSNNLKNSEFEKEPFSEYYIETRNF